MTTDERPLAGMKLLRFILGFLGCVAFYLAFAGAITYLFMQTWFQWAYLILWAAPIVVGIVWAFGSLTRDLWRDRWGPP